MPKIVMNKYLVQVELGTYDSSVDILNLFNFPGDEFYPDECKITIKRWSEGKTYRNTYKSRNKMLKGIKGLRQKKFNEIEFTVDPGDNPHNLSEGKIQIVYFYGELIMSPLNELWGNVIGYKVDGHFKERARKQYASRVKGVKLKGDSRYPTYIRTQFKVLSSYDREELVRIWADLLSESLDSEILDLGVFGMADIRGKPFILLSFRSLLGGQDENRIALDQKFDNPHDIYINRKALCEELLRAAKDEKVAMLDLGRNRQNTEYALLYFFDPVSKDEHPLQPVNKRKYPELFMDTSPKRDVGKSEPDEGIYISKGHRLFKTRWRIEEEIKQEKELGIYEPDTSGYTYFPIIKEEYHEIFGLDPYHLPLVSSQKEAERYIFSAIEANLKELQNEKDERIRILKAHIMTYEEYIGPHTAGVIKEFFDFIGRKDLSELIDQIEIDEE